MSTEPLQVGAHPSSAAFYLWHAAATQQSLAVDDRPVRAIFVLVVSALLSIYALTAVTELRRRQA